VLISVRHGRRFAEAVPVMRFMDERSSEECNRARRRARGARA
jgi:hypothetical protein